MDVSSGFLRNGSNIGSIADKLISR